VQELICTRKRCKVAFSIDQHRRPASHVDIGIEPSQQSLSIALGVTANCWVVVSGFVVMQSRLTIEELPRKYYVAPPS
jgi:hypothetical protein